MTRKFINLNAVKNKLLVKKSRARFCDYFKDDRMKLDNSSITVVSAFDHWLSFDEARELLPGWSDKTDSNELGKIAAKHSLYLLSYPLE